MQKRGLLATLLFGPLTPSIEDYHLAVKGGKLTPRTDFNKTIFDPNEVRLHNDKVSIVYFKSELAETIDMALYGQVGGLVVTIRDGEITTITKDAQTYKEPVIDTPQKLLIFQIFKAVRKHNL